MYNMASETVKPLYPLHPYQRQVLSDIIRALETGERRVVAHLPTGAGKTRVASHVACHMLNNADDDKSVVVWLASTEELCEQAADELATAWSRLGRRETRVHRNWGQLSVDLRRLSSGFLVSGLQKLRASALRDNTLLAHVAQRTAALIFDEAHQAVANTYSFMTEQLCSARPPLLGLTATPGRTSSIDDADYRLADMFRHNKVTIDSRGHGNPVTYLIQNRFLADARFVQVEFESESDMITPSADTDYSAADLDEVGKNSERNRKIAELAKDASRRHRRVIVFCPSVESALECRDILQGEGIAAFAIAAGTDAEERRRIIDRFKGDEDSRAVLFNYGVLTAGFDAPRTSCAIIARPTTSMVLYSQMAGRALRGPRSGGNPRATIFTVADTNLPGFGSVADAFENWEEIWESS